MIAVGNAVTVTKAGEFQGEVGKVVFIAHSTPMQACVRFSSKVQRIFDVGELEAVPHLVKVGDKVRLTAKGIDYVEEWVRTEWAERWTGAMEGEVKTGVFKGAVVVEFPIPYKSHRDLCDNHFRWVMNTDEIEPA
jgi:hypothetical protein